jgi:hypothetical protein
MQRLRGWVDVPISARHILPMPTIELTDTELADAARGMRLLAKQAQEDVDNCTSTATKHILAEAVRKKVELAQRFERARGVTKR